VTEELLSCGKHIPVLLEPVIQGLNLKPDGCYLDGTFGRGGHSREILKKLGSCGRLVAIDRDPAAIADAPENLKNDSRLELISGKFSELRGYATERNLLGKVDGLLLDLGVSSPQLDEADRGFSFRADGPLDMRMDPSSGESAADWLASVDEKTLIQVLRQYGEEPYARPIAKAIIAARQASRIETTAELTKVICQVRPKFKKKRHPATQSFQAIRIFINDELVQLRTLLIASTDLLSRGGRLCVISFHSLEDRIVKRFMRRNAVESEQYRGLPDIPPEMLPPLKIIGKPVTADAAEIVLNRRARSARLRIAERQ